MLSATIEDMQASRDFQDFLDHLTENARQSLQHAEGIAQSFGSSYIGTEHILLGVLSQESSVGSKLLNSTGITLEKARTRLKLVTTESSPSNSSSIQLALEILKA